MPSAKIPKLNLLAAVKAPPSPHSISKAAHADAHPKLTKRAAARHSDPPLMAGSFGSTECLMRVGPLRATQKYNASRQVYAQQHQSGKQMSEARPTVSAADLQLQPTARKYIQTFFSDLTKRSRFRDTPADKRPDADTVKLLVLCGKPGCGKMTTVRAYAEKNRVDLRILDPDLEHTSTARGLAAAAYQVLTTETQAGKPLCCVLRNADFMGSQDLGILFKKIAQCYETTHSTAAPRRSKKTKKNKNEKIMLQAHVVKEPAAASAAAASALDASIALKTPAAGKRKKPRRCADPKFMVLTCNDAGKIKDALQRHLPNSSKVVYLYPLRDSQMRHIATCAFGGKVPAELIASAVSQSRGNCTSMLTQLQLYAAGGGSHGLPRTIRKLPAIHAMDLCRADPMTALRQLLYPLSGGHQRRAASEAKLKTKFFNMAWRHVKKKYPKVFALELTDKECIARSKAVVQMSINRQRATSMTWAAKQARLHSVRSDVVDTLDKAAQVVGNCESSSERLADLLRLNYCYPLLAHSHPQAVRKQSHRSNLPEAGKCFGPAVVRYCRHNSDLLGLDAAMLSSLALSDADLSVRRTPFSDDLVAAAAAQVSISCADPVGVPFAGMAYPVWSGPCRRLVFSEAASVEKQRELASSSSSAEDLPDDTLESATLPAGWSYKNEASWYGLGSVAKVSGKRKKKRARS